MKFTLDRDMYLKAAAERKTFSQLLEEFDPSPEGSNLDAFERQLKKCGIVTKTLSEKSIYADIVDAFYRTSESKVLFPEFISRQVREAIAQDTMLPYLVGQRTLIQGDAYRTYYVEDQPEASRKKRVTEAAELPRAKIVGKEHMVRIYKFGRAIEASYETIRRMQIDMLALHVRRIAMQVAKDKVDEILNVIKDGDGNDNAATVYKLSTLDSAASGKLTPQAFLKFAMKFKVFPANTFIGSENTFVQMLLGSTPSLSTAELVALLTRGATSGVTLVVPQLPLGTVRVFWHENVSTNHLIAINREFGIEEVTEAGSDIQEADKFITRQTDVLTISENTGYSKMFNEATAILDIGS